MCFERVEHGKMKERNMTKQETIKTQEKKQGKQN